MKLIFLHGENIIDSRNRLVQFIKVAQNRSWDTVKVTEKSQNIKEIMTSDSLFGNKKLVVIYDINLIDKKTIDWLNKHSEFINYTVVIYHKSTIGKRYLNKFHKVTKNEEFKLPKLIWSFLDSFYPGNSKNVLILLAKVLEKEPVEFVFSLLSKHIRDIYWVKSNEDSLNYPSWRKGKLKSQGRKFADGKIENIISEMAKIDIKSKTTNSNLKDLLDFILITHLE